MATNIDFLRTLERSFHKYIEKGARSNEKLKILHGFISDDLIDQLGEGFEVHSLNINGGKEKNVDGVYYPKKIDIVIEHDGNVVCCIGVKYIMSNYKQNSNNYFESMIGETANIRKNGLPYCQIFVIFDHLPYFKSPDENGTIAIEHEHLTEQNVEKYIHLSNEDKDLLIRPDKMLFFVIKHDVDWNFQTKQEYNEFFNERDNIKFRGSNIKYEFGPGVTYNNYNKFVRELVTEIVAGIQN